MKLNNYEPRMLYQAKLSYKIDRNEDVSRQTQINTINNNQDSTAESIKGMPYKKEQERQPPL